MVRTAVGWLGAGSSSDTESSVSVKSGTAMVCSMELAML